ncbi:DUF6639 family protein [Tropicimonas marinistellae]|uniref:DUF6639 family protein n=1 Tax=Tropicimonas marinistellae TaxID=1739787 RepID=UPI00122DFEC6|nr:DUF6639 family protein [Tropicimonas marinistellae]
MTPETRMQLIGVFALLLCAFHLVGANAGTSSCEMPLVLVDTDDQELQVRICKTVTSVLPMLEKCQLKLTNPVTISFSKQLGSPDNRCFGHYLRGKGRVVLLEPKAFEQAHKASESWTAIPAAEHFDAIVVHEFTHALVDQNALVELSCSADEEYIAYAMQVASLSEPTRSALLTSVGASIPTSTEELNPLILGFSPTAFAARSWLHFSNPENGCAFVGKIIRGEVTFWMYPE